MTGMPGFTQDVVTADGVELAYLEAGRPGDPLVLCFHGFPDSPITWRHLARDLAAADFRVVMPWLRGYPPSQVVHGPYQIAALARDAIALADALSPGRPAYLVGHDWGAHAAYGAAVLAPDRWAGMATLAVVPTRFFRPFLRRDADQQRASWYQFLFQVEPLAEAIVSEDDFAFVDRLWADWSPGWTADPVALDAAKRSIRAGFPASLLYYRDAWQPARQDPALATDQQRIVEGTVAIPALALHGMRDGCILPGAWEHAGGFYTGESVIDALPGAGHFLHLERPALVNSQIVSFFTGHPG